MKTFLTILALVLAVAPAHANDRVERAKAGVEAGLAAQAAGNYAQAIALYQQAYDEVPHPEILFDLGQAHRLAGELEAARDSYERYLSVEPNGRLAKDATRWIHELEPQIAAAAAARTTEEARPVEPVQKPEPPRAPEPPPIVISHSLVRAAPPPRAHSHRTAYIVVAGGASAVAVIGGLVFGQLARAKLNEARGLCPGDVCATAATTARAEDLVSQAHARGNVSTGLVAAGAVGLTATAILWWTGRSAVAPVVTDTQVGVAWAGRF